MDKNQKALLLGMSIGDGSIGLRRDKEGRTYTASLQIIHTEAQLEYLIHKKELLHSIIGGKNPVVSEFKPSTGYRAKKSFRINKAHKYFMLLHRWLYSNNGKKEYTRKMLDKLTPQAIAIWYMDDGCGKKAKSKVTGKITSVSCHLSTYCSEEEADEIIAYFKETWGVIWKKRFHKRPALWYLECNTAESKNLEKLIGEFVIPSMRYKLPSFYSGTSAEQS